MADNRKFGSKLGEAISIGMMGFGQGLSGQPYLTNYQKLQEEARQFEAAEAYKKWENSPEQLTAKAKAQMLGYIAAYGDWGKMGQTEEASSGGVVPPMSIGSNNPADLMSGGFPMMDSGDLGQKMVLSGSLKNPSMKLNPIAQAQFDIQKNITQKMAEKQLDVNESALTSQYNLNLSVESLADYSKLLAKSWREGGAGDILKGTGTKLAMKGVPIGGAERYKSSGALQGKLVEIVSKTFPMLTQQIGKEGSVRLIESVFSRLSSSYPNENTPPELAPEQIKQSILSMYRINRALQNLNLKDFDLTKKDAKENFINRIATETSNIEFKPEEQESINQLTDKILSPIYAQLELNRRAKLKKGKK